MPITIGNNLFILQVGLMPMLNISGLKDYLQLDGLAYKLVPIKTPIVRIEVYVDMGELTQRKCMRTVQKWNWRNINDGKIYLDEQTQKN